MQKYYSVEEISMEIGVSIPTIRQKAKNLGFDTQRLTENRKKRIINACQSVIQKKNEAKELLNVKNNIKYEEISSESGSTLEKRLEIAKREFDCINKSLAECQNIIDQKGTMMITVTNGAVSSNPAVKTKCELLKQHNALQKTIQDLENALKLSLKPSGKINTIDDE